MTWGNYTSAALDTPATHIDNATGGYLSETDLPWSEPLFYGNPITGEVIRDRTDPGVNTIVFEVLHDVPEWSAGLVVALNEEIRSTAHLGYVWRAQNAGTTHATTEPVWPTVLGQTVVDNGITWECVYATLEPEDAILSNDAAGLDVNTPGAPLDFGVTEITAGAGNARQYWVRLLAPTGRLVKTTAGLFVGSLNLKREAA